MSAECFSTSACWKHFVLTYGAPATGRNPGCGCHGWTEARLAATSSGSRSTGQAVWDTAISIRHGVQQVLAMADRLIDQLMAESLGAFRSAFLIPLYGGRSM